MASFSSMFVRMAWICTAFAAAACGSRVQIDQNGPGGGGSGATSSPGGGAGAVTDGGAGGSTGTGTGASACAGLPPYAGPLCGPSDSPCKVLADENLGEAFGGNDAPAVAVGPNCDAHVVYAALTAEYKGYYADRKGPGQWEKALLPGASALAGHVIGSDGTAYLLTYDGAMETTLRARPPGGDWQDLGPLPAKGWFASAGLAIDDADLLHAAWVSEDQRPLYAIRGNGEWFPIQWQDNPSSDSQVAVTPDGLAHLVFWAQAPSGWAPRHASVPKISGPPLFSEPIAEPGQPALDPPAQRVKLALSADGTPLSLLVQEVGDPPAPKLSVARREPGGGWTLTTLLKPQKDDDPCANTIPLNGDDTCVAKTNVVLVPLAVVVSRGGDTRFLWGRQWSELSYSAKCTTPQGGETICSWKLEDNEPRGTIHIARFGANDSVIAAELAEGRPYSGNAVLDRRGVIHMAVYDAADPDHSARYLQIGP